MDYDCLIIEGGGFKTAFTSGIVDVMIFNDYYPFKRVIGNSGGSVALSYYLSKQYRSCIATMRYLATDSHFAKATRIFAEEGYLDIDYLKVVATEKVPFDVEAAYQNSRGIAVDIVATNRKTGEPTYLTPTLENWVDCAIASSTLPMATKGKHQMDGATYLDGGWSDPLPVQYAIDKGCKRILVLRTYPASFRAKQTWPDYFASYYFKSQPSLAEMFETAHENYNNSLDLIAEPPSGIVIDQIAPKKVLKSGTYSYSKRTLMKDYRYALDKAMYHFDKLKK